MLKFVFPSYPENSYHEAIANNLTIFNEAEVRKKIARPALQEKRKRLEIYSIFDKTDFTKQ